MKSQMEEIGLLAFELSVMRSAIREISILMQTVRKNLDKANSIRDQIEFDILDRFDKMETKKPHYEYTVEPRGGLWVASFEESMAFNTPDECYLWIKQVLKLAGKDENH